MATKIDTTTPAQRAKELPRQIQQVCKDLAVARYERHYHPRNKHHRKHVIVDLVLATTVFFLLLLSAYIFLFYRSAVLREGIQFSIVPDREAVVSGEELTYTLNIKNFSGGRLQDAVIEFPKTGAFIASSVTPLSLKGNTVAVGTLEDKEEKQLRVTGYLLAEAGADIHVTALLRYHAGTLSPLDEKLTSETLQVSGSSLTIELNLPESLIANQPFPYKITYRNQSPVTNFDQVSLFPNWPPGFEILSTSLPLDPSTEIWTLDSIGSLEQGMIEGEARLLTTDLEEAKLSLRAFSAPQGAPLLQAETDLVLPVRYPNVTVQAISKQAVTATGKNVTYAIELSNNESFALTNLHAVIDVNSAVFDAASLPADRDDQDRIMVELAANLEPGQTLSKDLTLKVRDQINAKLAFGAGDASIRFAGSILYDDQNGQVVEIPVQPVKTQINTDLSAQSFARYYSAEGDQIGRGPVPPHVGETTKYWVFIHLTNQIHVVNDVFVTAVLPSGVDWTGKKSMTEGKSLDYAQGSRQVSWDLGSLPDYKTDYAKTNFGIAFEVAITPDASQAGQLLSLLDRIEVQGRDAVTGQIVSVSPALVTSALGQDSYAPGDGKVLP